MPKPFGLVLVGGQARRMGGGHKPFSRVGDRTILERVLERLAPQCSQIAISVRGDRAPWSDFADIVLDDDTHDGVSLGPLAGVLAGLRHIERVNSASRVMLSVPGDTPFLPPDLAHRLLATCEPIGVGTAMAASGGRLHPAVAVWPAALRAQVEDALSRGQLALRAIHEACGHATVHWATEAIDPFFNVNTPEDLRMANELVRFAGS